MFAHDTKVALQAAIALVNTEQPPDSLTTIADVDKWYLEYPYTGRRDGDQSELEALRELRPVLRNLLTSERDDAAGLVNTLLAEAGALPQLVRHEPFDWHLHAVSSTAPLVTRITVETAMAMVDIVRQDELSRLGVCADADCGGLVADLSRNRSRRFCSTACGNRNAVAAYRARRATTSLDS